MPENGRLVPSTSSLNIFERGVLIGYLWLPFIFLDDVVAFAFREELLEFLLVLSVASLLVVAALREDRRAPFVSAAAFFMAGDFLLFRLGLNVSGCHAMLVSTADLGDR